MTLQPLQDFAARSRRDGMKILFLASTLPRFPNDHQAPFVLDQAVAWKRFHPQDEVYILAPHDRQARKREEIEGVKIRRFVYFWPEALQGLAYPAISPNIKRNSLLLGQLPFFLLAEFRAAVKLVRGRGVDLVYAHWVMPQGLVAYWVRRRLGIPYVLQNHSSDLAIFSCLGSAGRAIARRLITEARVFFCVNPHQKEDALRLFQPEVRAEMARKMTVFPMGVNASVSVPKESSGGTHEAREYDYDFGMISRLSRKKGVKLFIEAVNSLKETGVEVTAAVAGDGEERKHLEQLNRWGAVDFLGFLSGPEKADFFRRTRFLVFPSVPAGGEIEGLPVALLEALYCGKLIVASQAANVETLREWDDIKEGVIVLRDPADSDEFRAALERLLTLGQEDLAVISQKLRATMKRYSWDSLIREYADTISTASMLNSP